MRLRTGQRLRSVSCATTVIVVRAGDEDVDLRCGGHPMVPLGDAAEAAAPVDGGAEPAAMGKRYQEGAVELLCTKAGGGGLTIGSVAVQVKQASALPTSD
jgi:hypothetical protein